VPPADMVAGPQRTWLDELMAAPAQTPALLTCCMVTRLQPHVHQTLLDTPCGQAGYCN
jgi:hypothetical protein